MNRLDAINPEWAWREYEPDHERPWNRRRAAHLFRRAGFAASRQELDRAVEQEPSAVVRQLFDTSDAFRRDSDALAETILATGDSGQLSAWWVHTMLRTPCPLLEKTTLFWHGHFATSAEKVQDADAMYNQNRLLRQHALGDFGKLVHEIARDPAMLIYLDSLTNRKAHPNENFARELMELFCLGEGNYTEQDVRQLARCFTGWEIRRGKFRFNRFQHDSGDKEIFGKAAPYPDGSAIDAVLEQPSAPDFVVGKLIRYFLFDEPAASAELVRPLADELLERDWEVGPMLRRMISSNLFFSDQTIGRKVRSPVDLTIGLMRALEASTSARALADELRQLGQGLFYPPNVKGWDGGRTWINSATLIGRANVVRRLLYDKRTRFGGGDLASYFDSLSSSSAEEIVDTLMELNLAVPLPAETRAQLVELAGSGERSARIAETIHAMSTIPEFHLC